MAQPPTPQTTPQPYFRCLEHFEHGIRAFFNRPADWVGPVLVFGGISLVAGACCCLPMILVQGPLSCGLFACALAAMRGLPFETQTMARGWELAERSIVAALAIHLLPTLIASVLIGLPLAVGTGLLTHLGTQGGQLAPLIPVAVLALWLPVGLVGIAVVLAISWFHARTMFVLPLIADRGLPFTEAFGASWKASGERFWDLWALHIIGALVMLLCSQLCAALGLLIGVPLYHCMVASAYEERFSGGKVAG